MYLIRKSFENTNRWFSTIINQPQVKKVIGDFKLCEKMAQFDPKKAAEAAKAAGGDKKGKKEEKKSKEEKKPKEEKKKEKKEDVEEPMDDEPKPVKQKDPFEGIPKVRNATFN